VNPSAWTFRMSRLCAAAGLLVAAACSETPVSPSSALSGVYGLVAGDYLLTIYVPKGAAAEHVICVDASSVPDSASIPVTLTVTNGLYRVTPVGEANLNFQLLMQMTGPTSIYGPVLGQARDPETGVVVTISPPVDPYYATSGDATLSGLLAARNFAAGGINGSVQFSLNGAARWCNTNNWILKPR
jgi:hypothetical protein